jgi:DNA primase
MACTDPISRSWGHLVDRRRGRVGRRLWPVAGRIRDDDVALVRERARIDEVVSAHVTLRGAGAGSLKGLCPFHDEKSPSFHVTPARGFFHCFGCQQGGDVITFVEKIEGVGFTEAVERLASRYHVELRYVDDGGIRTARREPGQRQRLVAANRAAAEYYTGQLTSPDAAAGRQFLDDRGFDSAAAAHFGVGYAPRGGDDLLRHLRQAGFSEDELVTAGLVARGTHGSYDRFRGRLLWPIRELSGDVVGFGARRLHDDDRIEAKYLNTPETPLYKKSQVLYGLDLARKPVALSSQAVVVEGYTDVMACHLAGVETAIATCGTAFGEEHARTLRRLMLDNDEFRGEVIFTFDGDAAGQKAALRAFQGDQQFVAQTYVAVEPGGRDPCELRLAEGDAAVRELVARRVPLYRFVLGNVIGRYDLDRADARVDAIREAARLVSSVRDRSKVEAFVRELAGMVGADVDDVRAEVRRAGGRPDNRSRPDEPAVGGVQRPARPDRPDPLERRFSVERDVLKLVLQASAVTARAYSEVEAGDFTHPTYREIFEAVASLGGPLGLAIDELRAKVADADGATERVLSALVVEPLHLSGEPDARVAEAYVVRLRELTVARAIAQLKSRLQRMNPVDEALEYNRMFGELVALEARRRALRDRALGPDA